MVLPCVVLVINDNPYGLMFALRYPCRFVHCHHLNFHVLDSRFDAITIIKKKRFSKFCGSTTARSGSTAQSVLLAPLPEKRISQVATRQMLTGIGPVVSR